MHFFDTSWDIHKLLEDSGSDGESCSMFSVFVFSLCLPEEGVACLTFTDQSFFSMSCLRESSNLILYWAGSLAMKSIYL